jgi:membrane dipeptidase
MSGFLIDALQYANWSEKIFRQMRAGGVDAVHVTIAYHEDFAGMVRNLADWNLRFRQFPELIARATCAGDIDAARASGRTAILFGTQTPRPIGEDLGLIEICHQLGLRFMQPTYNNQSALATGCYEATDAGLTRFGHEALAEMNRVGLVPDLSHTAERSTLETIAQSARPVAITHANPHWWHPVPRNKSDAVLRALTDAGGMLGFSLYPLHLRGGAACSLDAFCEMVAECAARYGAGHLGLGSDLCQDQPDSVVHWMRQGRWTRAAPDAGDGFPPMPGWFAANRDFAAIRDGLARVGFSGVEIDGLMGDNWYRFFDRSFGAA